jgi:hypothetical protein
VPRLSLATSSHFENILPISQLTLLACLDLEQLFNNHVITTKVGFKDIWRGKETTDRWRGMLSRKKTVYYITTEYVESVKTILS